LIFVKTCWSNIVLPLKLTRYVSLDSFTTDAIQFLSASKCTIHSSNTLDFSCSQSNTIFFILYYIARCYAACYIFHHARSSTSLCLQHMIIFGPICCNINSKSGMEKWVYYDSLQDVIVDIIRYTNKSYNICCYYEGAYKNFETFEEACCWCKEYLECRNYKVLPERYMLLL